MTVLSFGFTLVTRNVRDFIHAGIILHNPFEPSDACEYFEIELLKLQQTACLGFGLAA